MNARSGLLVGLLLAAPALQAQEPVSFSRDIVPVLRTQCAGCHLTGEEPGGMRLYPSAAYQSLVGVPAVGSALQRVAAGDPPASYLLHKLRGTHLQVGGEGVQMPFAQPPLADETLQLIERWIEEGAQSN